MYTQSTKILIYHTYMNCIGCHVILNVLKKMGG